MQILNDEAIIKTWQARVGKPNRINRYTVSIGDVINFYRVLERNLLSGAGRCCKKSSFKANESTQIRLL